MFDVRNVPDSLNKVNNLGEALDDFFVLKVAYIHEGMEVSPGEVCYRQKTVPHE